VELVKHVFNGLELVLTKIDYPTVFVTFGHAKRANAHGIDKSMLRIK
jgi:hypothetical protein